jgi:hypothetical protein
MKYMIKIGEVNNRDIVAFSNNVRFHGAKVNYIENVIGKYPDIQTVNTQAVKMRLLNVGLT